MNEKYIITDQFNFDQAVNEINQRERITIQYLTGEKVLEPIIWLLREKRERFWWFFTRSIYYIECEYVRIGPIYGYVEALKLLKIAQQ